MTLLSSALAIDVEFVKVVSTPLQMLIVLAAFVAAGAVVITLLTLLLSNWADRRWPASQPLDPTEMLWGEMGGYVQKTFAGLELGRAKDLAESLEELTIPAGTAIVEQGDPATHFYIIKKGTAEVIQTEPGVAEPVKIREYVEGDSFGEVAILRRRPRTATVRATSDCVLLQVPAPDFLAAAAVASLDGTDFTAVVETYLSDDAGRLKSIQGKGWNTAPPRATVMLPKLQPGQSLADVNQPVARAPQQTIRLQAITDALGAAGAPSTTMPGPAQAPPQPAAAPPVYQPAAPPAAAPPVAAPPQTAPPVAAPPQTAPPPAAAPRVAAPPAAAAPRPAGMPELAALPARFRGTHRLPPQGASLYTLPDATQQPIEQLAARAEVQVLQTWGSWSRVWTEQGRDGWVDGRLLRQL